MLFRSVSQGYPGADMGRIRTRSVMEPAACVGVIALRWPGSWQSILSAAEATVGFFVIESYERDECTTMTALHISKGFAQSGNLGR